MSLVHRILNLLYEGFRFQEIVYVNVSPEDLTFLIKKEIEWRQIKEMNLAKNIHSFDQTRIVAWRGSSGFKSRHDSLFINSSFDAGFYLILYPSIYYLWGY